LEAELLGFKDDGGQPTYLINHALLEIPKIGDSRPASVGNYDVDPTKRVQRVLDKFLNC
jgi:hypothetical protein